jgi:hypothetical protein
VSGINIYFSFLNWKFTTKSVALLPLYQITPPLKPAVTKIN